jgi:Ser/Thr protein kinase RdoA (MazF antagonist)
VTTPRARELIHDLWGLDARLDPLPADRDQNFRVRVERGATGEGHEDFVLKLFQSREDRGFVEAQDLAMARLAGSGLPWAFPRVVPTLAGERAPRVEVEGVLHLARLVTWVPGTPLAEVGGMGEPMARKGAGSRLRAPERLREVGALLGAVDRVLARLEHPSLHRDFEWDIRWGVEVVERHSGHVASPDRRRLLDRFLELHALRVAPRAARLPAQAIHGDGNDHNVLVGGAGGEARVSGLLDFGDMIHSWRVGECAVGAAYALLGTDDPLAALGAVASGYHREFPLTEDEFGVLFPLTALRLCVSVVQSARRVGERPGDPYLRISEAPAWRALEILAGMDPEGVESTLRRECAP